MKGAAPVDDPRELLAGGANGDLIGIAFRVIIREASGGRDAAQRLHRTAMKPYPAHRFAIAPMMD
jgi:hypothetical protein